MDSLQPQLSELEQNIATLQSTLQPLLTTPLSTTTSKLPLLDKAKLYILSTYALESILFSYLRLNNIDAKNHPVFQELARVKEYFGKIQTAEQIGSGGADKAKLRVDKDAAERFIKAGLSGNEKYDAERREREGRERAGAKRKLEATSVGTHTRFEGAAKRIRQIEGESTVPVVKAGDVDMDDEEEGGVSLDGDAGETVGKNKGKQRGKKDKKGKEPAEVQESAQEPEEDDEESGDPMAALEQSLIEPLPKPAKKTKKRSKKKRNSDNAQE